MIIGRDIERNGDIKKKRWLLLGGTVSAQWLSGATDVFIFGVRAITESLSGTNILPCFVIPI